MTIEIRPTAILWFDNDARRPLEEKIERGVAYFKTKYRRDPDIVMVHPCMLPETPFPKTDVEIYAAGVRVQPKRYIMPNHFWIGVVDVGGRSQA